MPARSTKDLEEEIDRLYRLPLDEFVSARNALSRRLSGGEADRVRALKKPAPAAWAANQLYWRARDAFLEVGRTADELLSSMKGAGSGGPSGLRDASKARRESVQKALHRTLDLLQEDGRTVSASMRQSILHTLEALPGQEPPGRFTVPLEPRGFDVLVGMNVPPAESTARPRRGLAERHEKKQRERARPVLSRRDAERRAAKRLTAERNDWKQALRMTERALARARKEAQKADKRSRNAKAEHDKALSDAVRAREQMERMQKRLASAEKQSQDAAAESHRYASGVADAETAVAKARQRLGGR